jgi:DNA polymerase-3 subunit delta'
MGGEGALREITGQDAVVTLLRRALATDHVAHAYAFVGPPGVGRKTTALAFARALVTPGPAGPDAGWAERVSRGAHPDVHLIRPTPPESNPKGPLAVRVESIRDLERMAALRPVAAPLKVFIVDDADRMTAATPQAFLKTLEEPPARTVIILILSQPRALPPTVLSRCQIVRFAPLQPPGTVALLPDGRAEARQAALAWLTEVEAEGVESIVKGSEALGRDRDAAETLVETCWLWYRDLLCAHVEAAEGTTVFGDRYPALRERARRASLEDLLGALGACREAWQAIQGNVSPRLTVEVLLSRLARADAPRAAA